MKSSFIYLLLTGSLPLTVFLSGRWSKREELDFIRVISFFGVDFKRDFNRYDWTRFRQLASLGKKSDERLTVYLHDFKQICWKVLKKKPIKIGG